MRSSLAQAASSSISPFRRLRNGALAAVAGGAMLLSAAPAAAQSKVAVIDVRRAVLETEQGLRVQATLKKLFDSRQADLDSKQRQLQTDKEVLDKEAQGGKVSKEVLQKKYETLQRAAAELQNSMVESQREMQRKEGEMTTPILQGVLDAVKRIAAQDGFEMVLEKSAVPYFRGRSRADGSRHSALQQRPARRRRPQGRPGGPRRAGRQGARRPRAQARSQEVILARGAESVD